MSLFLKRSILPLLAGLVLGAAFALLLGKFLDAAEREQTRRDLGGKLERVAGEFEPNLKSRQVPDDHVRIVARQVAARVTIIAADGAVLADSDVRAEDLRHVENHGTRPEVVAARHDGFGFGERLSATVNEPFVYAARRVGPESAPLGFVRLAIGQAELDAMKGPFRETLFRISIGAGLLVALLVLFIRQRHALELSRVRGGVAEAADGRRPQVPPGASEETDEVFAALGRFAKLVAAQREGSEKARILARTVFEEVPVGLVVVDRALDVLDANAAALQLFHVPPSAPRKALVDLVRDPEVMKLFAGAVEAVLSGQLPDSAVIRLGGELTPEQVLEVTVRAVPHGARSGEPAAVGVVRDVTERERNETMRRRFVSDVSHELRTPIASIRAAIDTLAGEEVLPLDLARLVSIIQRQSGEMQDLVSDLTDLSQMESGAVTLQIETFPLQPLLLSVVKDLASFAESRQVTVAVEGPPDLTVRGDRRRLAQVFRNLVDNAVKFSPPGARVDVLAENRAAVVVHVVDRGIGIARSEQDRIFQRFYRVDPSRAKSVPGTGLGLAIVKHLLILHGGSIKVESEPGKGSRFTVALPVRVTEGVADLQEKV
jgi:two-component system phosphate regulon sensor histidine kinase PhoR